MTNDVIVEFVIAMMGKVNFKLGKVSAGVVLNVLLILIF